jgi:hypothetical protein
MDENLHNIEDLFQSALDQNEETPSRKVWEQVDKRLDKDNIISIKRKYTNLKRIAILLLFLLTSFALFDIYKISDTRNGNRIAANSDTMNSVNFSKPDKIADNNSNKHTETNSVATSDTNNALVNDKEKSSFDNSVTKDESIRNRQKTQLTNKTTTLQKQNTSELINLEKIVSKNQEVFVFHQKKKVTTMAIDKIKTNNATAIEDEENLVKNNDVRQDNEISGLQELKYISRAKTELLAQDSIGTNKLNQLIILSKIKITDISNNVTVIMLKKKESKPSKFSITTFFSPDIAWYRLQDDKVGNQSDNANELEKEEKHEFSSTYGALVDYKIGKRWGLHSGFTLANTNITVAPKTIYAQQDNAGSVKYRINTSSGYGYLLPNFITNPAIGDSLYAFTSTHSLQYIGIPLAVCYNITKGKFKVNVIGGVSVNILTRAKLETTVEKGFNNSIETIDNIQGLKKIYFSGLAGVGIDYKLNNKTSLTVAPTMRFALNSINKDAPVKSYPMSFGFTVGLKIRL